jgi:hypothetical protein
MRWRQWRKGKGIGKEKRRKKRMKRRRMVIVARLLVCQFYCQSGSPKPNLTEGTSTSPVYIDQCFAWCPKSLQYI